MDRIDILRKASLGAVLASVAVASPASALPEAAQPTSATAEQLVPSFSIDSTGQLTILGKQSDSALERAYGKARPSADKLASNGCCHNQSNCCKPQKSAVAV